MKVNKKDVPIEIRRLVANHFESIRESEIGDKIKDACLGEEICPIYRPDIKDVAYFQFEVKSADNESIGFILVSADEHDFPIPHWSLETAPISTLLEYEAKKHDKKAGKIYKLDTLAYILEDDVGEEAARLGNIPGLITDLPENLADYAGNISSSESVVEGTFDTDENPEKIKHNVKKEESKNPKHKIKEPKSWKELKDQFGKSFKQHLELHKKEAKKTWDTEKLIRNFGEGIFAGVPFYIPFLENGYNYDIIGEAKEFVKINIVKRPNCSDVAELICDDPKLGREASFSLKIKYDNNEQEKLEFFIVTHDLPSNEKNNTNLQEV